MTRTHQSPTAELDPDALTIWAESAAEAENFLQRLQRAGGGISVRQVFVGKRSGKDRGNDYLDGTYYQYDKAARAVLTTTVSAPDSVIRLVQWCSPDLILSARGNPVLAIEDTTHLQGNNIFQRLPRVAKSSFEGIPVVTFQGLGPKLTGRSRDFALQRLLHAHTKLSRIGKAPSLILLYDSPEQEKQREFELRQLVLARVRGDETEFRKLSDRVLEEMDKCLDQAPEKAPPIRCFNVTPAEVRVKIGVRPERKSWAEKGSGQMDTYTGLIFAAKLLFGLDENGEAVRKVVAEFLYLPPDFWWFRSENRSLYNTLPKNFSDSYEFGSDELGKYAKRPQVG